MGDLISIWSFIHADFDDLTNVDNSSSPLEHNKIYLLSHMIN